MLPVTRLHSHLISLKFHGFLLDGLWKSSIGRRKFNSFNEQGWSCKQALEKGKPEKKPEKGTGWTFPPPEVCLILLGQLRVLGEGYKLCCICTFWWICIQEEIRGTGKLPCFLTAHSLLKKKFSYCRCFFTTAVLQSTQMWNTLCPSH